VQLQAPASVELAATLDDLAPLLIAARREKLAPLRVRLANRQFRVLVVGEAKRGKSTFINALIERDVLPTGVLPVTALVTTLQRGTPERVIVTYADGRKEQCPLDELSRFVSESQNPENRLGVESVLVVVDAPILEGGLQLVDTPGTGSVFAHNTHAAEAGLDDVDAAVFVLTADPPISAAEAELLRLVQQRAQFLMFVLNKVDYLPPLEVEKVRDFTVTTLADVTGRAVELFECSAAHAVEARRRSDPDAVASSGVPAIRSAFMAQVRSRRDDALTASIVAHARRLLDAEMDDAELAARVAQARTQDELRQLEKFRQRLDAASDRRRQLRALVDATRRTTLDDLDTSADRFRRRLAKEVLSRVAEFAVDRGNEGAGGRQIEEGGRALASDAIRMALPPWQEERAAAIQDELRKLHERISADVSAAIDDIRAAGRNLLEIDLTLAYEPPELPKSTRFNFDFNEDAGSTELLAGSIRRHLPAPLARRRAMAWLNRDVTDLIERHVGRARADLQERLAEACAAMVRSGQEELEAVISSLVRVLSQTPREEMPRNDAEHAAAIEHLKRIRQRLTNAAT
jgi:GTP-binding protein EngB required for normal cell division